MTDFGRKTVYQVYQLINKTYEFASAVCFTSGIAIKIG